MILDERTEFADAVTLTTGTGTNNEGDIIDMGTGGVDAGQGQPVYVVIQVDTAMTSGGSATVQFSVVSDSTSTIATDGTQTIHFLSDAFAVADMTAGATFVFALPVGFDDVAAYERYLAFQVVVGTAALTAGAVNAFLTLDPHGWTAHADASN